MGKRMKQWWLVAMVVVVGLVLLATGLVGVFTEAMQLAIKKVFLVSVWYGLTYVIRVCRLGHIKWDNERLKVYYYFVLLIGSAMIVAWG